MKHSGAILTAGPVSAHLVKLTVPMIWGIFAMMAFNFTDTWFVAQLGERELAAMSFTFPVVMLLISLGIGMMAGTSSVLARAIGAGQTERVQRLATDALLLALILSAVCTAVGLLTMDPLFAALGANEQVRPLVKEYMSVWYAGFAFILVPMTGFGVLRATGDSAIQGKILIMASVLNLILDPLLIFGLAGFPRMELEGAAVATVLARGASLAAGFWAVHFKHGLLTFTPPTLNEFRASCASLLHVGLPAAGTNMIVPAATGGVVAIVATFGPDAVAGFGAATRVEQLTMVVFFAMSAVIGPFVGQNLGAGHHDRVSDALRVSALFCAGFGLLVAAALASAAEPVIGLFGDNETVNAVGRTYLWTVPISYGAYGVVVVVIAAFNGMGQPMPAVAISVTRMGILYLPLAWLGAQLAGIPGVFLGASAANLLAGALAYGWFVRATRSVRVASDTPPVTRP